MGVFIAFSLLPSVLFLAWAWYATLHSWRAWGVYLTASVVLLASPMVNSALLFVQMGATLVIGLFAAALGGNAVVIRTVCLVAFVLSYAGGISSGLERRREMQAMRKAYPIQSLANRLAYETERSAKSTTSDASVLAVHLPREIDGRLRAADENRSNSYRRSQLRRLHLLTTDEFIMSPGFGVGRMPRVSRVIVDPPPSPPISISSPSVAASTYPIASQAIGAEAAIEQVNGAPRPRLSPVTSLFHERNVDDFFNSDRFGYVIDREHVAGFHPHQFSSMPELPGPEDVGREWQVVRLELVGLLKHDEPRVYLSPYLPRMDELAGAPTRPLDDFESRSLPQLLTEADTVVDEKPNVVKMIGSLRAGKSCIECHLVRHGELLGAFSYELHRKQPLPQSTTAAMKPEI